MYSTNLRVGKGFAVEQKICELRKLLLRSKYNEKIKDKRVKPNEFIKKVADDLKNIKSTKCGYSPEQTEEQALNQETENYFQEVYGFHGLIKVEENKDRLERFDSKTDRGKKRLRDPLETAEKVSVLAERLQKKDATGRLYKSTAENKTVFNRSKNFTIRERTKRNDNTYLYWLEEDG